MRPLPFRRAAPSASTRLVRVALRRHTISVLARCALLFFISAIIMLIAYTHGLVHSSPSAKERATLEIPLTLAAVFGLVPWSVPINSLHERCLRLPWHWGPWQFTIRTLLAAGVVGLAGWGWRNGALYSSLSASRISPVPGLHLLGQWAPALLLGAFTVAAWARLTLANRWFVQYSASLPAKLSAINLGPWVLMLSLLALLGVPLLLNWAAPLLPLAILAEQWAPFLKSPELAAGTSLGLAGLLVPMAQRLTRYAWNDTRDSMLAGSIDLATGLTIEAPALPALQPLAPAVPPPPHAAPAISAPLALLDVETHCVKWGAYAPAGELPSAPLPPLALDDEGRVRAEWVALQIYDFYAPMRLDAQTADNEGNPVSDPYGVNTDPMRALPLDVRRMHCLATFPARTYGARLGLALSMGLQVGLMAAYCEEAPINAVALLFWMGAAAFTYAACALARTNQVAAQATFFQPGFSMINRQYGKAQRVLGAPDYFFGGWKAIGILALLLAAFATATFVGTLAASAASTPGRVTSVSFLISATALVFALFATAINAFSFWQYRRA